MALEATKESKVFKLLENNDAIDNQIRQLEYQIKVLKGSQKENYQKLWNTCDHNWVYDTSSCFDDLIKYHCTKCYLYKRKDLYF